MSTVLICGSRDYDDAAFLWKVLAAMRRAHDVRVFIHGGAKGADTLAGEYVQSIALTEKVFKADWQQHGKAAGPIRNHQMLTEGKPDLVVAFVNKPLTESRGTHDMVSRARSAGIRTIVCGVDDTGYVKAGEPE